MRFIATCAAGLESLTAAEIREWGGRDVTFHDGAVSWTASLECGYRACLWSRFASKILLTIDECKILDADALYESAKAVPWEEHLAKSGSFAVDCTLAQGAPLNHSKYAALRVKDAVVDRFRSRTGDRPSVRLSRPEVRLNVHVGADRAILAIDLSGESLHRRGYRISGGSAPLKESLAAAIIKLSGWCGEEPLLDPMCGSATLLIEAALQYGDSAPGLGRSYFGLTGWLGHDTQTWTNLVEEATEREIEGQKKSWPALVGFDGDQSMIHAARQNIERAGLDDRIRVRKKELHDLTPMAESGYVITNPPYGERLSEKETAKYLYRFLGNRLGESFGGWMVSVFISNPDFADLLRIPWQHNYRLYNGSIACRLFTGRAESSDSAGYSWKAQPIGSDDKGIELANRLKKNLKKRAGWVKQNGIHCYRLYDRDLPEYQVSIDLYDRWVFVHEYPSPSSVDRDVAGERFRLVLHTVRAVLGVGRDQVFIRPARRNSSSRSAGKSPGKAKMLEMPEGTRRFLIDLQRGPETGPALDQRSLRLRIGSEAPGCRFLSIYENTGAAAVHAVCGGGSQATVAGVTDKEIGLIKKNFALNGVQPESHFLVAEEVISWLKTSRQSYDLIYIAPYPRTIRWRKPGKDRLDEVIGLSAGLLSEGGVMYLATEKRSFTPDRLPAGRYICRDLSRTMLPPDFERNRKHYRFWEIRLNREEDKS